MSTEHLLLRKTAKDDHPLSINVDVAVLEVSDTYSLNLFKTHPRITEAFEHEKIVENLTSEQLEQLAVRLLYIASYASTNPLDLLERYGLEFSGNNQYNRPLEL